MNYFYSIYTNNKSELLAILSDKYTEVCHEAILKFLEKHDKLTVTHSSDKDTNLEVSYNNFQIAWKKTKNKQLMTLAQIRAL